MNRTQLEHVIRAASALADDKEIVVIGSQAIDAQFTNLPPAAYLSREADLYPLNHPERSDDIDGAIGAGSIFEKTFGYYADGTSPETATLPASWRDRLVRLSNENTGGATGLCLDVHDIVLSKYNAGREKDLSYCRAIVRHGCVNKKQLLSLIDEMPVEQSQKDLIRQRAEYDLSLRSRGTG
jgi:hypothetical protein